MRTQPDHGRPWGEDGPVIGEENDSNEHEDGDEENQYGGGEGDVDAVEQTERVTDERDADEVDDESQEGSDADG